MAEPSFCSYFRKSECTITVLLFPFFVTRSFWIFSFPPRRYCLELFFSLLFFTSKRPRVDLQGSCCAR